MIRRGIPYMIRNAPAEAAVVMLLVVLIALLIPCLSAAQASSPATIRAVHTTGPITLDGTLNEDVWASAPRIANFTQRELNENMPATEQTAVAVVYTATELYLGIWCFDAEPDKITARKMQWDFDYGTDDNFEIVLDSYADRRNAYLFVVNPNGSQADALVMDNGRKMNEAWNGVWYAAATTTAAGWFAEIRIPFSTLKFSAAVEQRWGVNFERNIRHKREQVLWQGWSRDASIRQVSRAGTLEGLRNLTRMKVWEFRPYVLAGAETARDTSATTTANAGVDFGYLINPTVKLDFTINPDFAQVESDRLIVNLTRFSISYPEKRQFFLEAQNFFDFSLGRAQPYYSRRIGIDQGRETPILGGVRFLGKVRRTTLGAMVVQTGSTDSSRSTNYSLLRWKQDLGEESSVGLLAIGETQVGRFNGTAGVDLLLSTSKLFGDKNLQVGGAIAATYTSDGDTATGTAHRLFVSYPNDLVDISGSWERAGSAFKPEVGFLSRTSYQRFETEVSISPRPRFLPWVQQLEFKPIELAYYIDDVTHTMQSVDMEFRPLGLSLKSGDNLEINVQRNAENLLEDFEIRDGYVIPAGRYWMTRGEIQVESFDGRAISTSAAVTWGRFYDGSSTEWEADLAWKVSRHFSTSVGYQRADLRLTSGAFAIDELLGRMSYSLSPSLFGSVFAQWNNDDDEILLNFRGTWIPKPGAALYVVLNQFGDTQGPRGALRLNKTIAMTKFVWYYATQ
jgi:hypothetical protein